MSFTGDLDHLPIVDVIQLLHSTRKNGTLRLNGPRGESQLVFQDGYIVSANHSRNNVRIGRILIEMGVLAQEQLETALAEQKSLTPRPSLIALLIESGRIKKEDAFKGLEILIEMTIVEVLTWAHGTFSLEVETVNLSDDYRYFPERLKQDIYINTQNILMDALRIYDEKVRDGELTTFVGTIDDGDGGGDGSAPAAAAPATDDGWGVDEDVLGLSNLDNLEKKIPDVYLGLKDADPGDMHREVIRTVLPHFPAAAQEEVVALLSRLAAPILDGSGLLPKGSGGLAVILYSRSELLRHILTVLCKHAGYFVFTTDDEINLDPIIEQTLRKRYRPVLVIEGGEKHEVGPLLEEKRGKYPSLATLILTETNSRSLYAFWGDGATAALPLPPLNGNGAGAAVLIDFIKALQGCLAALTNPGDDDPLQEMMRCSRELDGLLDPPEVVFALLRHAASRFPRVLVLIVGKGELIAERAIGIGSSEPSGPLKFRMPLSPASLFAQVVEKGTLYRGGGDDPLLRDGLYSHIGAPVQRELLLLPVRAGGRTIALIYGDFDTLAPVPVRTETLEILARQAELQLDLAQYRKRFEKAGQPA